MIHRRYAWLHTREPGVIRRGLTVWNTGRLAELVLGKSVVEEVPPLLRRG